MYTQKEKIALGIGYTFCACFGVFTIWYWVTALQILTKCCL